MQGLQLPAGKRAWLLQPVLRSSIPPSPGVSRPSSPTRARPVTPSQPARVGGPPPSEATAYADPPSRRPASPKPSTRPGVRPPLARHPSQASNGANDGIATPRSAAEHTPAPHPKAASARPNSANRRPVSSERRRSAGMADSPSRLAPVRSQPATSRMRRPQSARSARAADKLISHHKTSDPPAKEESRLGLVPPQQAAVRALELLAEEDKRAKAVDVVKILTLTPLEAIPDDTKTLQPMAIIDAKDEESAMQAEATPHMLSRGFPKANEEEGFRSKSAPGQMIGQRRRPTWARPDTRVEVVEDDAASEDEMPFTMSTTMTEDDLKREQKLREQFAAELSLHTESMAMAIPDDTKMLQPTAIIDAKDEEAARQAQATPHMMSRGFQKWDPEEDFRSKSAPGQMIGQRRRPTWARPDTPVQVDEEDAASEDEMPLTMSTTMTEDDLKREQKLREQFAAELSLHTETMALSTSIQEARLNKQSQISAWLQRKDAERAQRRQAEKEEAQVASEQERLRQQRDEDREAELARQKIVRLQAHARRQQELVADLERAKLARTRASSAEGVRPSCKATMAVALDAYATPRPPSVPNRRR